jgi:hydrogenase maturation factor
MDGADEDSSVVIVESKGLKRTVHMTLIRTVMQSMWLFGV